MGPQRGVAAPSPSHMSRLLAWLGWLPIVTIAGRRTGRPRATSLAPVKLNGHSYLVAVRGSTDWAANLGAAGGGQIRSRGRTNAFSALEVSGPERQAVLDAYRRRVGWTGITRMEGWPTASRVFRIESTKDTAID
jgi:deazaflavin-dependent oxidoreductase (nitroreductase family)